MTSRRIRRDQSIEQAHPAKFHGVEASALIDKISEASSRKFHFTFGASNTASFRINHNACSVDRRDSFLVRRKRVCNSCATALSTSDLLFGCRTEAGGCVCKILSAGHAPSATQVVRAAQCGARQRDTDGKRTDLEFRHRRLGTASHAGDYR